MSHLPHSCPMCGSGVSTAGLCDACNRTAETQPEKVFPSAPEQNFVQEAAPVSQEAWDSLTPEEQEHLKELSPIKVNRGSFMRLPEVAYKEMTCGEWDLKQDCKECGTRLTSQNRVDVKEFEELCYTCYKKKPKHVCVDLDGVLAEYDGWKGPVHIGPLRGGGKEFLKALVATGYKVIIHTTRQAPLVWDWLKIFDIAHLVSKVTSEKLPALAYLDDRGICFEGDFDKALEAIKSFTPHWRR